MAAVRFCALDTMTVTLSVSATDSAATREAEPAMKTNVSFDRSPMYIGVADDDLGERHISLVPYVPDLEAFCGQRVRATRPGPWRAVVISATCPICRARGMEAARRLWKESGG